MRTRSLAFALSAGLALSACATIPPAGTARDDRAAASPCVDWRWIGITDESASECPTPGPGWTSKPLFTFAGLQGSDDYEERKKDYGYGQLQPQPTTPPQGAVRSADVVAELDRFCVYETAASQRPRHPPFRSPEAAGLERLERDCAGISRAGVANLTAAGVEELSRHFFAQAGKAAVMDINNQQGVRLAFLDTQPTGDVVPAVPGTSKHGYTLAHIANGLVCSPQNPERCAAQITTRLAMPMLDFDPARRNPDDFNYDAGGGFGTQGDLAAAIVAEVNDWQIANASREERQHLVLNLSLGWDPWLLGGLREERIASMRAGTQAVYRALQYAKSFDDVLVLAAAGNRRDCCPPTKGPLLPAAWEAGSPADDVFRDQPTSPLLYAVGGVRSDGRPLANAREEAMPRRVAYGENGVVATRGADGISSTWLYTGSSVATAVVSAAAALVWDTVPTLTPAQVMQVLDEPEPDEAGTAVPFPADFWFGSSGPAGAGALAAPDARQVAVCAALLRACHRHSVAACPVSSCPAVERQRSVFPAWAAQPTSTACHPWLVPQPEDPLCPPCNPPYNP